GRAVPIQVAAFSACGSSQAHTLEMRIAAAVGDEDRRSRCDVFDLRDEAPGAENAAAVQMGDGQRSSDFVAPGREGENLIVMNTVGAIGPARRTEAVVQTSLQRGGVVGRSISDGTELLGVHHIAKAISWTCRFGKCRRPRKRSRPHDAGKKPTGVTVT